MAATLRETIPLQKRKIIKKSLASVIGSFLALAFFGAVLFKFEPDMGGAYRPLLVALWWVLLAGAVTLNPLYQYLYFLSYFYDVDDQNVTIRKGVVAKKEITLPFSKITDVYVDQDVADAAFGLYDVHISTPTESSGQFAHIDGVNREGSLALKGLLLDRVNAAAG